ncbi:uncharacterized protein [Musca autumnalis]|uniref:uncharacterized protein n=1 Tax=Musca autumnalis TaxID=221902 RepID=UPI003CF3DD63
MSCNVTTTICRTCLDPESRYFQISDYVDDSMSIMEMLDLIVPQLRVMEETHSAIAPLICEECLDKLLQCYRFQQLCIDADNQLRKLGEAMEEETNMDAEELELHPDSISHEIEVVDDKEEIKIEIERSGGVKEINTTKLEDDGIPVQITKFPKEENKEEAFIDIVECESSPNSNLKQHFCTNCDKKFKCISLLESHSCTKIKGRSLLHCEMCNTKFANEQIYKAHMERHQNELNADSNGNVYVGELVNEGEKDEIEVELDNLITEENIDEDEHYAVEEGVEEVERENNQWSDLDNRNDEEYLYAKQPQNEDSQNYSVGDCEEAVEIEKPNDKNRRSARYPCEVCGKVYDRISRLQRHSRVHSLHKKYECDICKARFSTASYLKIHQVKHLTKEQENVTPPAGGYKCPDCPRRFEKLTALSGHRRQHSLRKVINDKLLCNYCQRKFLTEKTLTEHIRNKHPEEKYTCDQCDRTFVLHSKLMEHMSLHRELICNICNKEFPFESLLKEHMRIHSGESPYLCPECGKTFKCSGNLRQHLERHSTEKRYACTNCPRRFKCRTDLKKHQITHVGTKNFACDICGIRFTRQYSMEQHRRLHITKRFNHTCDLCQMSFNTAANLRRHTIRLHPDERKNVLVFDRINQYQSVQMEFKRFPTMQLHEIYGRICRACMSKKKNMLSTKTKHDKLTKTIDEMLQQTFPQIQEGHESFPVPEEICRGCFYQLVASYKFQRICVTTNDMLYNTWSTSVVGKEKSCEDQDENSKNNSIKSEIAFEEIQSIENIKQGESSNSEQKDDLVSCDAALFPSENCSDIEEENLPLSSLRKLQKSINDKYNQIGGAIIKSFGRNQEEKEPDKPQAMCDPVNVLSETKHQCNVCSKTFSNENMLQKHKLKKHKEAETDKMDKSPSQGIAIADISIDCFDSSSRDLSPSGKEENETTNSDNELQLSGNPKPKSHYCPQCKATFRFEKQMERHLKKHTDSHRFVCIVCHDRFKYPFMLHKHNEKHHPEEVKNKTKLTEDKKEALDKSYTCNYCTSAYTNVGGLAQHMSKKHPEIVPFKCDKCSKTFVVEEHLKIHTNRHMGIKNFQCELCDKSFSFKFAMKQHMRIHTGDLNYLCTLCGKKFYRPSNLRQHMQRHGDDKPYSCPHCPKRFKCPSDRYIHLMSHQQGKNHVCSTCGARFSRVDTLHQHVKVLHSGEKPYKCDQCPMAFPRLMNLNRHRRTHTGEKPYKCKYCDKAYAQSNDLNKHLRTHVGENTYMCNQCPMAFKYQADLRNHEWEHYRKEKEEEVGQQQSLLDLNRNET